MPEGDTVHRAAERIRAALAGRVPERILTPQPRHRLNRWPEKLAGRALSAVDAHGKHLFLRFEGGLTVHSHLRTSGSWAVQREGSPWRRSERRAWLVLAG
ncbi:MAG TPA: DNA-formamidopyrimidine glycosylase family protein, partial [Solirubrobacteraceae bacterium]